MKIINALMLVGFSLSLVAGAASAKSTAQLPTSVFNKIKIGDIHGPVIGPGGPKVQVQVRR